MTNKEELMIILRNERNNSNIYSNSCILRNNEINVKMYGSVTLFYLQKLESRIKMLGFKCINIDFYGFQIKVK